MKTLRTVASALMTTALLACTAESMIEKAVSREKRETTDTTDNATVPIPDDAAASDIRDASIPNPNRNKIGTRSDKGDTSVSVDLSSRGSYTCDATCNAAGGSCRVGRGNGVGYVNRRYNNGTGTIGNQISRCAETEDYVSFNTTMTSMSCFCADMPVPPKVRVRRSEGLFACSEVCASWSLSCAEKRGQYAYGDEEGLSSTKIDCTSTPNATTHHYVCSCDI